MQAYPHLLTLKSPNNNTTSWALEIRPWNQDGKGTALVCCCFHPRLLREIKLGGGGWNKQLTQVAGDKEFLLGIKIHLRNKKSFDLLWNGSVNHFRCFGPTWLTRKITVLRILTFKSGFGTFQFRLTCEGWLEFLRMLCLKDLGTYASDKLFLHCSLSLCASIPPQVTHF